ncbi:hypothetical protein [Psychromonas arctica]|uniref:hypothetical protein n=1 Tax=Psychromonas arctica TaxID=168275 RepID=UPI000409CA2D|nr:hypothetical protein [Psychromonas arctica]
MKESDWKVFKSIKEIAIEKYCNLVLEASQALISKQDESAHNKYLLIYKLLQNRDEKMAVLFDGHSRSRAWSQLLAIRSEGLADQTLLTELSDEFREATDPSRKSF